MCILVLFFLFAAASSASSLTPPVLPLIVRNPYLSAWLGDAREPPWKSWPIFWTGQSLGLSVLASTPGSGTVYPLLGRAQDSLSSSKRRTVTDPEYLGFSYDASTTNFTYLIPPPADTPDPATVVLSFSSPITPTSTLRQSLPASYLRVFVDGGDFDVNLYVDINGAWVSGSQSTPIKWSLSRLGPTPVPGHGKHPISSWSISRETQLLFTEVGDRAEWGTLRFSGPAGATHQAGDSASLRRQFARAGNLTDHVEKSFRAINDHEPAFAFSTTLRSRHKNHNTASILNIRDNALFTFVLVQDPAVQFAAERGLTLMRPLWASYFTSPDDLIQYHYDDFSAADSLARSYSNAVATDARVAQDEEYGDILALSARQVMGATQFSGTPDDPILFLKEISSNGNFQTVDVIFPSIPFFLYTNPTWLAYLLEPLLEYQLSGQYPRNYSMHDLGTHFPNATGHADGNDEYMPIEECGDMLIMALALANALLYDGRSEFQPAVGKLAGPQPLEALVAEATASGPGIFALNDEADLASQKDNNKRLTREWLVRSYRLWKLWSDYLAEETLYPAHQLSTDDFAGALENQTNLALKGIIGIKAAGEIALLAGEEKDAANFSKTAADYIEKWVGLAVSRDKMRVKLSYSWYGSWTTLYNLMTDSLLCFRVTRGGEVARKASTDTNAAPAFEDGRASAVWAQSVLDKRARPENQFVPEEIYAMQSTWYSVVLQRFGLPLDNRHLYAKSDWEFFAAAVSSDQTRRDIVHAVATWINETTTGESRP